MATGNKLEVGIGADITDFQKKVKEVESDIRDLSKIKLDQLKLGLDTKEINAQIKDAKNSLATLKDSFGKTGAVIGGQFTKGTANGSNALMQFSRIAQDAPYGIIGIGNNLTATAEAFSHLKNQTGTTGGAFKALASSLMGSGGILLGISLLTTGFTLLSQSGLSVGDVIDKLTGNFDANTKELQDMNAEVAKNSQAQISSLNALVSTAKNVRISDEERLIAVKKLQSEYPAYFGNLSTEEILNGNVATAVKKVTQAIIAKAKAAASVDKIVKLAEEEEKIQSNIKNELAEVARGYQLNKKEAFEFAKAVLAGGDAFKLLDPYKKRAGFFDVANAVALNNTLSKLNTNLSSNRAKQDKLTESINNSTAAYINLEKSAPKEVKTPKVKEPKEPKKPKFEFQQGFIPGGLVAPSINFDSALLQMDIVPDKVNEKLLMVENALLDFNTRAGEIINSSISDTFSGLGSAIGGALATGGNVLKAAGNSLLAGLGGILTSLGAMAIEIGVGMLGIKAALKTLNPFAAIAAGVALVALGSIFSSKATSLGGSMGGSSGSTSTSTGAGANTRTTSSSGGSSFSNGGTVVFEISGQSLIGVLSNTLDKNKRLGGSLAL